MLILAVDTTSVHGGAGIFRDARCLACETNPGPPHYSVTLFEMVERLLAKEKLALRDVELFAVANGPGSFTGIRTGVAAAQGWASAFARPACGVSVFEAMVEAANPETEWAIPILDARRGEYYLSLFRREAGDAAYRAEGEGMVLKPDTLREFLAEFDRRRRGGGTATCLAREPDTSARALLDNLPDSFRRKSFSELLLAAIARLACHAAREGRLQSPAALDAYYIRRTDAEVAALKARPWGIVPGNH